MDQLKDAAGAYRRKLEISLAAWGKKLENIASLENFFALISKDQEKAIRSDFEGAVIKERTQDMPIYLWIADERVAVFSIPSFSRALKNARFF